MVASSPINTVLFKDTSLDTYNLLLNTASLLKSKSLDPTISLVTNTLFNNFASFDTLTPSCKSPSDVIIWLFVTAVIGIVLSWNAAVKKPFTVRFLHSKEAEVVISLYKNNSLFTNILPCAVISFASTSPENDASSFTLKRPKMVVAPWTSNVPFIDTSWLISVLPDIVYIY